MITLLYAIFISFFATFLCGGIPLFSFISRGERLNFFSKNFFKAYIKQIRVKKIFFIDVLKYPIFLSSSFAMMQFQILGSMRSVEQEDYLILPILFIVYLMVKIAYVIEGLTDREAYFHFHFRVEEFFLDMVLIGVIYICLAERNYSFESLIGFFFLTLVLLRMSSFWHRFIKENNYKIANMTLIDSVVLNLGEYVYILSLLFFFVDNFFIIKFSFVIKMIAFIVFSKLMIGCSDKMLGWLMKKKGRVRRALKFKCALFPIFLVIFLMQLWMINDQ